MAKINLAVLWHFILALCLTGSLPLNTALAQHETMRLTDAQITAFIEEMSEMSSGKNLDYSASDIAAFLEMHLHPEARFKSEMEYVVPGHPAQTKSMALNKAEFMDSVSAGAAALEGYENRVTIGSIKISKDKRKATVQTRGIENGSMQVADESGMIQSVPVEGLSDCQQIIMLNDDDIMQIYNANCKTTINFTE